MTHKGTLLFNCVIDSLPCLKLNGVYIPVGKKTKVRLQKFKIVSNV